MNRPFLTLLLGGMVVLLWGSMPAVAMKGDLTRPMPTQKRYTGVQQQQGRVQTDADMNEAERKKQTTRKVIRKKPAIKKKRPPLPK